ncbi:uncharacterized protein LOC132611255 [Lycium barbarum]|uniref:uncharacterized protein LOC132611255 n=1 Tax=Lycium barbarum TaxID=112863 RepID=UPI00293E5855|nr:uncharacterized protein LOC132611255 [Lycium barbarum]
MASLKIHPTTHSFIHVNKSNPILDFNTNTSLRVSSHRVSASLSLSNPLSKSGGVIKDDDKKTESVISGKIDEWMKESMVDIIKNLKEAPLLVHVYDDNGKGEVKIKTEKAKVEDWPVVKNEWESGKKRSPDGLIFVGELGTMEEKIKVGEDEGITKAWGVVVQGKGVECSPACYLLKTSRVGAGFGMGLFSTHFCLARVQNFRDSALVQFKNSWLLQ